MLLQSGMNYTVIADNLIVGSQPQKPEDINFLKEEEGVAYILNLQQDKDVEYWGINLQSIIERCKELGIRHMRQPVSTNRFNSNVGLNLLQSHFQVHCVLSLLFSPCPIF